MRWLVVGAGSGGCVAAARLADDPRRDVLLLEAGPALVDGPDRTAIEGADFLRALELPGRTHRDVMAKRDAGTGPLPYVTGRGVGGSSAVNTMLATRGDPAQYASWGWADVDEAWRRVAIPSEVAAADEFGPIDRALSAAAADARPVPLTRRAGRRVTSADAYLGAATRRPNLTIRADAPVARVRFHDRRAGGVELNDGTELSADRVVVAAGAINSPALLLRSGVTTPGIGSGLQDHPSAAFTLELREPSDADDRPGLATATLLERNGIQVLPVNRASDRRHALLACALMRPTGRAGRVSLSDVDPTAPPDVELNLFADRRDLTRLGDGVRLLIELLADRAFAEVVAAVYVDEHGTGVAALNDGRAIERWLPTAAGVYVHATSTCAIGRALDDDGSVLGYEGLYVCDASAFPGVPAANPHLPTTMLAERLAARWTL